jgi:hypothetical protein
MTISQTEKHNYLAKLVHIEDSQWRPHSNADKLKCVTIDFQNVITGIDAKAGFYVYFPVECQISDAILKHTNSYRDALYNEDKEQKGFFEVKRRVKAIKLRGERSQGYLLPAATVFGVYKHNTTVNELEKLKDTYFDLIDGELICQKYEIPVKQDSNKQGKQPKRMSRLVDGQFRHHVSTDNLRKSVNLLKDKDRIAISYKLHGSSVVLSNVMVKKKLNIFLKILKWMKVPIEQTKYDVIASSRKVVRNQYLEDEKRDSGFYGEDIWMKCKQEHGHKLPKGFSIYGELVGETTTGEQIQKHYDYGTGPKTTELYVYRVTFTNTDGIVYEFNTDQIQTFCERYDFKTPKVYFQGSVSMLKTMEGVKTNEDLVKALEARYNDKDCYMCTNKVPEEGIVIRRDDSFNTFEAWKLKSAKFLELESKTLDAATV